MVQRHGRAFRHWDCCHQRCTADGYRYARLHPIHLSEVCRSIAGHDKKEQLANKIYKSTGLSTDDLLAILPGSCDVLDEQGILTLPKHGEEE